MTIDIRIPKFKFMTILTFVVVMCGTGSVMSDDVEIDMDGVMRITGRFNIAHACPVNEQYALTAAHVTDIRWTDITFPLFPYRFENFKGDKGIAKPRGVLSSADIGWLQVDPLSGYYQVSNSKPAKEDRVYWIEYNFKKGKHAFRRENRDAKVIRVFAGQVVFNESPAQGASGGCLFNDLGEVVGIISSGWTIGSSYNPNVGMAVGLFGEWMPDYPEDLNDEKDSEEPGESIDSGLDGGGESGVPENPS